MRITGSVLDLFKYEDCFYRFDVGPKLGIKVPKCYFTGVGEYGRYCLLLDDFAPAKPEDQLAGLSPALIEEALRQIAKLHAKYRGKVTTSADTHDWVLRLDDPDYYDMVCSEFNKKFPGVEEYFHRVDAFVGLEFVTEALALGKFMTLNSPLLMRVFSFVKRLEPMAFPSTVCHGDFRAENFLFPQKSLGHFMLYDFQLVKENSGMLDVQYVMFSSMKPAERRTHEKKLLTMYYNEMHRLGATDLTWEEVCVMYGVSIINCACIIFISLKDLMTGPNKNDPKTRAFQKHYITSLDAVSKDWDVVNLLTKFKEHFRGESFIPFSTDDYKTMIPKRYHDLLGRSSDGTTSTESKKAPEVNVTSPLIPSK